MKFPEEINLDDLDDQARTEIILRWDAYIASHNIYNNIVNGYQCEFDRYRLNFPNDFNFNSYAGSNVNYQSAVADRRNCYNRVNSIMDDYFPDIWKNIKAKFA